MVSFVFWAAFGALIGWTAAILRGEKAPRLSALYVVAGVLGGMAGGFIGVILDPAMVDYHTTNDILFAAFGATSFVCCVVFILHKIPGRQN